MSMSHQGTFQGADHAPPAWIRRGGAVVAAGFLMLPGACLPGSGAQAQVPANPTASIVSGAAAPAVPESTKSDAGSNAAPRGEPGASTEVKSTPVESDASVATEPPGPTHRYARIPKRNAFGIKPPAVAAPPEPEKEPPKERPEFFLTGFTSVRGEKRAFVAYQPKGKAIQYPRALILDGEIDVGDGVLKLVAIDPIEKTVTIAFNGEEIPLNFKDNALKTTASAPGPAGGAPVPGLPGLPPSALRGNQPPPPIMNQPGVGAAGSAPGFFPGSVQTGAGGAAPTVIGRGGAILSGGVGAGTLQNTPMAANSIQAGGTQVHGGIDVPAVAPSADQLGGTVPANPSRLGRNIPPPPPAPFPGLPGQ